MATRAERFRSEQERSNPKTIPAKKARPSLLEKALRMEHEVSGTARAPSEVGTGMRNLSRGKGAAYALEDTKGATPSRKSTRRGGPGRTKAATPLTSRQKLKNGAPAARHARGT